MKTLNSLVLSTFLLISASFAGIINVEFSGGTMSGTDVHGTAFTNASYTLTYHLDDSLVGQWFPNVDYTWEIDGVGTYQSAMNDGGVQILDTNADSQYYIEVGPFLGRGSQNPVTVSYQNVNPFAFNPIAITEVIGGVSSFVDAVVGGSLTVNSYTDSTSMRAYEAGAVPEPTTMALMGLGLGGLALARRKRKTA